MLIVGDIHNKFDDYYDLVSSLDESVQVGDFGYNSWNKLHYKLSSNHKVVAGNHEDYENCINSSNYLGDFGFCTKLSVPFYFVRGGISLDLVYRVGDWLSGGQRTWHSDEELNFSQMLACIKSYKDYKPDVVITHAAPQSQSQKLGSKSFVQRWGFSPNWKENTALLLEELLKIHQPKYWIHGHFHKSYREKVGKTQFIGLAELETYNLEI